ncbi:ABC transporter ATP-binding protein [Nesterenkonia sp. YGD6]|uniref:ABC transporter ATP-binding protein n=1 Tax=Nesterenkonia sp. YGD6 TaxID=2901231 RepID=UPI001F4C6CB0|nr:ABC transporter ATP-binding protein [Nesterenkonia sp. YGD6]MCH8562894.1 ABC transporter ATP-binding protein [Nesterenkonia sp. YGD6]
MNVDRDVPAISCRGLTKRYGDVLAVDGLDLEVQQRSLFGFLGPNGAGKTTVMRLLLGLAKPTSGDAQVFGHDIVTESMDVRRQVGYLPQQPRFHPELSARQVLRYARGFFPLDGSSAVEEDITEVLDLVGLSRKADSRAGDLSGGQRQRLGIAQAQIHRPPLLILDEPASALDPGGRRDVLAVMRRLKETATVFYSTHILDDVQQVSDEIAILKDGRGVLQSSLHELLDRTSEHVYDLTLEGDVDKALAALRRQPWIDEVKVTDGDDGQVRCIVRATNGEAVRHKLLRLVLRHDGVNVISYSPRKSELEDVFLDVVEGVHR